MTRILLGLVRDRCREVGLRELELPYSWFVQVEPVAGEPRREAG